MAKFDNRPGVEIPVYTVATVPSAAAVFNAVDAKTNMIFVSDAATNACIAVSDGTNWLRADTGAVLS